MKFHFPPRKKDTKHYFRKTAMEKKQNWIPYSTLHLHILQLL